MTISKLGKYELYEELGRGGFGTVYRARDLMLEVERAVKVLHPSLGASPEFIGRFRREARVSAQLDHPNIVPVYEFGEENGYFFLVMKYMPAGSLKELLARDGALSFARSLEIMLQVASALDYAYSQPEKLIHRDIKPGNILFDGTLAKPGSLGSARLADFGFAKALGEKTGSSSLSTSGGMVGTPSYMAPEIWRHKEFTPATDVYSLACLFFEMITGKVLFAGDSPADIMTMHVLDGPQFPAQWPDGVPNGITAVLGKALSAQSQDRYQTTAEFASALQALQVTTSSSMGQAVAIPATLNQPEKTVEKPGVQTNSTAGKNRPGAATRLPEADRPDRSSGPARPADRLSRVTSEKPAGNKTWVYALVLIAVLSLFGFGALVMNNLNAAREREATAMIATSQVISAANTQAAIIPTKTPRPSRTPIPTSTVVVDTPTNYPTNTPVLIVVVVTATDPPPVVISCSLRTCDSSSENVCVYSFGPQFNSLAIALKFSYGSMPSGYVTLSVGGTRFDCSGIDQYPDRLYCTGAAISGNTYIKVLSSGSETICAGTLNIPPFLTPVPTSKSGPGKKYP
jgi:serine/threonine protein kinase